MKIYITLILAFLCLSSLRTIYLVFLKAPPILFPAFDETECAPLTENPKRIWAYWKGGPKDLPLFTKQNIQLWKHITDKYGWEIRLLHSADKSSPCHINKFIPDNMLPATFDDMYPQIASDSVRLPLITLYGGIYMDATIILLDTLEDMFWDRVILPENDPKKIIVGGFWNIDFSDYGTTNGLEPWMLAALPKEPLFVAWQDLFKRVMNDSDVPVIFNETTKEVLNPLLKGTNLTAMGGWANYLCVASVFKHIITHNTTLREQFYTKSKTYDVWKSSFRLFNSLSRDNDNVNRYIRKYRYPYTWALHNVIDDTPLVKLMGHAATLDDRSQREWGNPAALISMIRFYIASKEW